ncbi:putative lipoprotein, partial [Vibrio parahaemolyticus V-223/04]
ARPTNVARLARPDFRC